MTKRSVWIVCFIIALLSVASVAYRMSLVTHFDSAAWQNADEPSEYIDRRAMLPDVEQMFAGGKIATRDSADKILGHPERTDDDDPNIWYYNLGGERSSSAPDSITWLELTFDETGRLEKHRTTQELIVPDTTQTPAKQ
jgi:hypothetical protein